MIMWMWDKKHWFSISMTWRSSAWCSACQDVKTFWGASGLTLQLMFNIELQNILQLWIISGASFCQNFPGPVITHSFSQKSIFTTSQDNKVGLKMPHILIRIPSIRDGYIGPGPYISSITERPRKFSSKKFSKKLEKAKEGNGKIWEIHPCPVCLVPKIPLSVSSIF